MTFSIVARSADAGSWGVAVASKFLAVGAYVPAAEAGTGAIATQSYANLAFRRDGLSLLRAGNGAAETLGLLTGADERREERQVGVVDATGGSATFTGTECNAWAGGVAGDGYAIQGNILAGPQVIAEMEKAWLESVDEENLARRLAGALEAGDLAGGDRRGRQSAAVLVVRRGSGYGGGNDVYADVRTDDHPTPVTELLRLLDLHDLYFGSPRPEDLLPLSEPLVGEVADMLTRLGYEPGGGGAELVRRALWDWGSVENLEERIPEEPVIDTVVLSELRRRSFPK